MSEHRILVAVDGSSYSAKVVDKAIEYALLMQAELVLLHCHRKFPKLLGQPHRDTYISRIRDEANDVVKPFIRAMRDADTPFVLRLMEEPAGAMIPEVAKTEGCDLIVMGSRGLSNLQGLIIGSVTNRVLHLAHCAVMVVK